ncbi:MAG: CHC2 zinc finger domain-containing protein [Thermodesulfobacteriota bacterium]
MIEPQRLLEDKEILGLLLEYEAGVGSEIPEFRELKKNLRAGIPPPTPEEIMIENAEYVEGMKLKALDLKLEVDVLERCIAQAYEDGERYSEEIRKLRTELDLKSGQLFFAEFAVSALEAIQAPIGERKLKVVRERTEEELDVIEQAKRYYYDIEMPKIHAGIEQMKKDFGEEGERIRKAYLKKIGDEKITQEMIDRAHESPIDRLIEVNRKKALCIFHDDHRPSMSIKDNRYHCFVCEAAGDVIDLYMHIHNCDFIEAVRALNE